MSEQSAKPYLVRAICEWCADNGLTPYLAVRVNPQTKVPAAYVKNGEIVLNVSASATRRLTIDNDWIQFTARFNGVSQEVAVPMAAVGRDLREGNRLRLRVQRCRRTPSRRSPRRRCRPRKCARPRATARSRAPRPSHLQVVK